MKNAVMNFKKIILFIPLILALALLFSATARCAEPDGTESLSELAQRYRELAKSGEKQSVSDFLSNNETAQNQPEDEAGYDFSDEIKDFADSIPSDIRDRLPYIDRLEGGGVINPDELSVSSLTDEISALAQGFAGRVAKSLPRLIVIIISAFILNCLAKLFDSKLYSTAALIISTVIALVFFTDGIINIEALETYLTNLTRTAEALVSLLASVLVTGGNVTTASCAAVSVSVVCTLIQYLFSKIVLPLISMSLALSVAGSTGLGDFALHLADFLRKAAVWITVITATVATFALAIQSVLAKSADTVGIKTVKFALGSFVPIVGGALSETVNTVSAGLSYIKNTCGVVGIIVLLLIILPPIADLLSAKVTLFAAWGLAALTDCKREAAMLRELSKSADALLALFICSGASFTVFIIGIISCNLAIG